MIRYCFLIAFLLLMGCSNLGTNTAIKKDTIYVIVQDTVRTYMSSAYTAPMDSMTKVLMAINASEFWTSPQEIGTVIMNRSWFHYYPDGRCHVDTDDKHSATTIKTQLAQHHIPFTCSCEPTMNWGDYNLLQKIEWRVLFIPKAN